MNIYEFDIFDGDKGVVVANNIEEAKTLVRKRYSDDIPFSDGTRETWFSGACIVNEIGDCNTPWIYVAYHNIF